MAQLPYVPPGFDINGYSLADRCWIIDAVLHDTQWQCERKVSANFLHRIKRTLRVPEEGRASRTYQALVAIANKERSYAARYGDYHNNEELDNWAMRDSTLARPFHGLLRLIILSGVEHRAWTACASGSETPPLHRVICIAVDGQLTRTDEWWPKAELAGAFPSLKTYVPD